MTRSAWFLVLAIIGCSSQSPLAKEEQLKNLKTQAEDTGQAMVKEDHEKLVVMTHPNLVERVGGKRKFMVKLAEIEAQLKGAGLRAKNTEIEEPTDLVEQSGHIYAVVPFRLIVDTPVGEIRKPSFLIGVSADGGRNWTFLDGSGVVGDRAMLKQILPKFPDRLRLPGK